MSRLGLLRLNPKRLWLALGLILIGLAAWRLVSAPVYGAQLGQRAIQINNNRISQPTDYRLSFELVSSSTIGSILIQFCANDPLPGTACTAPAGFDAGSATLDDQSGLNGFTVSSASTANEVILSRPAAASGMVMASYHFIDVINPSAPGAYYVRVQTFATEDASGPASDYGGIAFNITDDLSITTTVPPYLLFCSATSISGLDCEDASGNFIDFGELSPQQANTGSSQLLTATNAELGYTVTVGGTTLTSGNNVITALAANDVSRPGTAQFGLNFRANSSPAIGSNPTGPGGGGPTPDYNQPNSYRFVDNEAVITHPTVDGVPKYTATYLVNVPIGQAAGIYVSTITYVCLANF